MTGTMHVCSVVVVMVSLLMVTCCIGYRGSRPSVSVSGQAWCSRGTHKWISTDNTSGVLTSPNYPDPYPNYNPSDCQYRILAPLHNVIRIRFTNFLLDFRCQREYVELYKGNMFSRENLIGKRLCRNDHPFGALTTSGDFLGVYFHVDHSDRDPGFRAEFTFIDPELSTTPTPLVSSSAHKRQPPPCHLASCVLIGVVVAMVGPCGNA